MKIYATFKRLDITLFFSVFASARLRPGPWRLWPWPWPQNFWFWPWH